MGPEGFGRQDILVDDILGILDGIDVHDEKTLTDPVGTIGTIGRYIGEVTLVKKDSSLELLVDGLEKGLEGGNHE